MKVSCGPLHTSPVPVQLNLRRVKVSNETVRGSPKKYMLSKQMPRSESLLFERALGIVPGKLFEFNMKRWQVLQSCGLFKSLVAKTSRNEDGTVSLFIEGEELPSIHFAPEASIGASLENPEISGGVHFRDSNFRGLGQSIDIMISAFKEGLEKGVGNLSPSYRISWTDGIKGRPSHVSLAIEEEHTLEYSSDMGLSNFLDYKSKSATMLRKAQLIFTGIREPKDIENSKIGEIQYKVEPYAYKIGGDPLYKKGTAEMDSNQKSILLTGSKIRFTRPTISNYFPTISIFQDFGVKKDATSRLKYRSIGADITSPYIEIASSFEKNNNIRALAKLKLNSLLSIGKGCIPSFHYTNFANPGYLRGFSHPDFSSSRMTAYSLLKADVHFVGIPWLIGTPGVFLDAGIFRGFSHDKGKETKTENNFVQKMDKKIHDIGGDKIGTQIAVGVFLKGGGLRCDIGWPCSSKISPKVSLGLDLE